MTLRIAASVTAVLAICVLLGAQAVPKN